MFLTIFFSFIAFDGFSQNCPGSIRANGSGNRLFLEYEPASSTCVTNADADAAGVNGVTYNGINYGVSIDNDDLRSDNGSGVFNPLLSPVTITLLTTGETCTYVGGELTAADGVDVTPANAGTSGTICQDPFPGPIPTDAELFAALGGTPEVGGMWTNVGNTYTYTVTHSYLPCITDEAVVVVQECLCYPQTSAEAEANPGGQHVNPAGCDVDPGEPTAVIPVPTFACDGSENPVTYDTPILPNNPTVLYHYWGNCSTLSPTMPTGLAPTTNGFIQQFFCETDGNGLPSFPLGLSPDNGLINFLPQSSLDVGCNGFADVGVCECEGTGIRPDRLEHFGTELIQLDFWLAVPNIQSQVGFRFGGGQCDAGSFFVGSDLNTMCEAAFYTDGMDHIDDGVPQQETGTFNITPGTLTETCGLSWMRIRIYIHDIAHAFTVSPEINIGNGWVGVDQLLVEPALTADDNVVPTIATTPVCGYEATVGGETFLFDAGGIWDPYGCNPVAKAIDIGICGSMCPTVNPIDVMDSVCDGMLGSTISDWMTSVEANNANIAAIADANTDAAIIYSMSAPGDVSEAVPPVLGTADASNAMMSCDNDTETTYAYLLCHGMNGDVGGGDDFYLLVGTHILTIYAPAEQPIDGIVGCVNTPVAICNDGFDNDDTFSTAASNPTGGAAIANWDGTSYTAQTGDLAGTVDIVVTTANGCTGTFSISTPACPAMCPAITVEDDNDAICDGTLGTEVSSWQTTVGTTNAAAIADANTAAALEYSSALVDGAAVLVPNGTVADGTWTGPGCADETQATYAYLLCYGTDATVGTADDMYVLVGTHVLTINPPAQDPTDGIVACVNTPVDACTDDTFSATATNPTGGAAIANWDGMSYTGQPGDLAGTVDIVVTTANGCESTFEITTPACPALATYTWEFFDPCNCDNPNNITLTDGTFLNADFIRVDASQYTSPVVILAFADANFLDNTGNPIAAATANFTSLGGGIFELPYYVLSNAPTTFTIDVNGDQQSGTSSVNCNCVSAIPTMSQWGLIIFGLLILNLGIFFLYRKEGRVYA